MARKTYRSRSSRRRSRSAQDLEEQSPAGVEFAGAVAGSPLFLQGGAPAMRFPHADAIRASAGAEVPGTAVCDTAACEARGVPAFTDGTVTHFASPSPPLKVAAHEGAHQLQHAGITRDANLGAERHADAVARRVSTGVSSAPLIGRACAAVAPAVRNYTEFTDAEQQARGQWKVGSLAKVGDEGRSVTTEKMHDCFADPALVTEANDILKAKKSGIELYLAGPGPVGEAPDGSGWKATAKVGAKILSSSSGDDYWTDCGRASREVQGPTGTDTDPKGLFTDDTGKRSETSADSDPATFRDEIYMKGGLGATKADAHAAYLALSETGKEEFDKKHGINKYAAPGVGESFVARRDDSLTDEAFNWHWGAVIMAPGPDRVTFENFAKKGTKYGTKDDKWYFETYGPPNKPGQTFHEQNLSSVGAPGMNTNTFAARTSPDPADYSSLPTAEILKKYGASADIGEKTVLESEMRKRWIKVRIEATQAQEDTDQVYVEVSSNGNSHETGWREVSTGGATEFYISVDKLAPITGHINVKVYELDAIFDDLMSNIGWDYPYARAVDDRPWDDGEYITTVEFLW